LSNEWGRQGKLYFPRAAQDKRTPDEGAGQPFHAVLPLLQDMILFEALDPKQLTELAAHFKPRSLEPGEVLFAQRGTEATLFIVVSGVLQISQHTEVSGQETVGQSLLRRIRAFFDYPR
jgi:hypothetical protein